MTNSGFQNEEILSAEQIGPILCKARKEAGLSVIQISELTRITKSHISALEASQFDALPGVAYIPGFIRNYCKVLDIDPKPFIKAFKGETNTKLEKPVYKFPVQALVPKMSGSMIAMFVVLACLAGYVGWTFIQTDTLAEPQLASLEAQGPSSVSQFDQTEIVGPEIVAVEEYNNLVQAQPADIQASDKLAPEAIETTDPAQTPLQGTPVIPETAEQNSAEANTTEEPDTRIQMNTELAANQTEDKDKLEIQKRADLNSSTAQAFPRAPMSEILISASATSWVEIAKSNGEVVVSKLLRRGDTLVTNADVNLFLSTGNAGGLNLAVGDQVAFSIGKVGEIIRDLPLSLDSLSAQNRESAY